MKDNIEILNEIFKPEIKDCRGFIEDLQEAIKLDPSIEKIFLAMNEARKQ